MLVVSDMRGLLSVFDASSLALLCTHRPNCGLGSPHAMSAWRGELYVADHDHHRVAVLELRPHKQRPPQQAAATAVSTTAEKRSIPTTSAYFTGASRSIGGRGSAPGRFEHPIGLALLEGLLLVSEFNGRRVQGLQPRTGEPLFVLPAQSGTRLLGVAGVPGGDGVGTRIYAGDFDLDRIHFWEASTHGSVTDISDISDVTCSQEATSVAGMNEAAVSPNKAQLLKGKLASGAGGAAMAATSPKPACTSPACGTGSVG